MRTLVHGSLALAVTALLLQPAQAQCGSWNTAFPPSQTSDGGVLALAWFDDGNGSALYEGGRFHSVAGVVSENVIRHDATGWVALGPGLSGSEVRSLAVFDDGSGPALYAGGIFSSSGGTSLSGIAKWDGSTWRDVGGGVNGNVHDMVVFDDGSGPALCVVGDFTNAGGVAAGQAARWDGTTWSALAWSFDPGSAFDACAAYDDGTGPALYVAAAWTLPVFPFTRYAVLRLTNGAWAPTGWPETSSGRRAQRLAVFDSGSGPELYAGGSISGLGNIVKRTSAPGHAWAALGAGVDGSVAALHVFDDGTGPSLFVGGLFWHAAGQYSLGIARWDGFVWSPVPGISSGFVGAFTTAVDDARRVPNLYVGGNFAMGTPPGLLLAERLGCGNTGIAFCFGDGFGTACPCNNAVAFGEDAGCRNSLGVGGKLTASGHASVTTDTFALAAQDLPSTATALYFQGSQEVAGGAGSVFGDGLRCAGGSVVRLATVTSAAGTSSYPSIADPLLHVRGTVSAGDTTTYQAWYRNIAVFCTPAGFNLTNAWTVTWHS